MTSLATLSLREDYWETFKLTDEDREFIYNFLLEIETPLTSPELLSALVNDRIRQEKLALEKQRTSGGDIYLPAHIYKNNQDRVFPAFGWQHALVLGVRAGKNPDMGDFQVIQVKFDSQEVKEFASNIQDHILNLPQEIIISEASLDAGAVLSKYGEKLLQIIDSDLTKNDEFVRIAGKWFSRALLVDINVGHLNLAEAILDMAAGGPLPTKALLEQVGLATNTNSKLVEFSLDHALQEDPRFDEVGPAGAILWFLNRLEPESVLQVPIYLRYQELEYDHALLTKEMLELERKLDDDISPGNGKFPTPNEVQ